MSIEDELFEDTARVEVTNADLNEIGALVAKAEDLEGEISVLEETLKQRKADLRGVLTRDLPTIMDSAGLAEFKTQSGRKVTIKEIVGASIPKARTQKALEWLIQNGHEALIKHTVSVTLGKGQHNLVEAIKGRLQEEFGVNPDDKAGVHAQTLAAFCREQLAEGNELPADLLGLYVSRQAQIK